MIFLVLLILISFITSAHGQIQQFDPVYFTLPRPPSLTNALEQNNILSNVERLHSGYYMGPTSFAYLNGDIYTVTTDRRVISIGRCRPQVIANLNPPGCQISAPCSLLTSIRAGIDGQLLVVDAYRGLFQVNATNGAFRLLYSISTRVNGRSPRFLNGLAQSPSGIIYMSDSSDKYDALNDIYNIMEGRTSGRILAMDPNTGIVTEVIRDVMAYPNGLEVTFDGNNLLIAESGRARTLRLDLDPGARPRLTVFSDNHPGCPTHIRRTSYGTYFVGLSLVRHSGAPSSMDQFSNNPQARWNTVRTDSRERIKSYYLKYGLVIEMNQQGTVLGSLHDSSGQVYSGVSEATEIDGLLYIGSRDKAFTGRFVLPQSRSNNDTIMQLLRSRCRITEQQYQDYLRSKITTTTTTATTTVPATTAGTTSITTSTAMVETTTITETTTAGTQTLTISDTTTSETQTSTISDTTTSETQTSTISDTTTSETQTSTISDTTTAGTQTSTISDTTTTPPATATQTTVRNCIP